MKNKLIAASLIASAAIAHVAPAVSLVVIATGGETARALGAAALLVSALALGYMHGLNRTLDTF